MLFLKYKKAYFYVLDAPLIDSNQRNEDILDSRTNEDEVLDKDED